LTKYFEISSAESSKQLYNETEFGEYTLSRVSGLSPNSG